MRRKTAQVLEGRKQRCPNKIDSVLHTGHDEGQKADAQCATTGEHRKGIQSFARVRGLGESCRAFEHNHKRDIAVKEGCNVSRSHRWHGHHMEEGLRRPERARLDLLRVIERGGVGLHAGIREIHGKRVVARDVWRNGTRRPNSRTWEPVSRSACFKARSGWRAR
jgi:hypothetical protein